MSALLSMANRSLCDIF